MISYYKKNKLGKSGELRYGEDLSAPKISSLFKTSIYLSSLFLLFPSTVFAAIHLLPDVQVEEKSDILSSPPKASIDSERCEKAGYTYYASGKCPSYHNQETCVFMDKYLKCDARGWCLDNGYATTSCTLPKILDTQCPNGLSLYKKCSCPSTYKYACTGTGYSSGNGTVCDGKYTKCNCSSLYDWTGSACIHTHSYSCPSGYSTSKSGMISPASTSKVCACGAKSGTCYKETHSHSYSCPSGYSTSCTYGYSTTTSKVCSCGATSGTCYSCLSECEANPCASGCYTNKSCTYGCAGYNSCGGCSSCKSAPATTTQKDYYFWCCNSECDYSGCMAKVGYSCSNNDRYTGCTGSKVFVQCVGPSYSTTDPETGLADNFPHNGARYFCKH